MSDQVAPRPARFTPSRQDPPQTEPNRKAQPFVTLGTEAASSSNARPPDGAQTTALPRINAKTGTQPPKPMAPATANIETALLLNILKVESDARRAKTVPELVYLMANETLRLVRAQQIFVLECFNPSEGARVAAVSSLALVDRNVPLVQWIERMAKTLSASEGLNRYHEFVLPAYCDPNSSSTRSYPFANFIWIPLWSREKPPSHGLLLARDIPWMEVDRRLAERLAETFGHAVLQLQGSPAPLRSRLTPRRNALAAILVISLLGLFPMPISALAPVEVVARNPQIVSMPVDAIVQDVLVAPNQRVSAGQALVRLVDTAVSNQVKLAEREVIVARARVQQANSLAFSEAKGRHDLGIAQAELELKIAELDYAHDLAKQFSITAEADGFAVFSDRRDLEGKPFKVGDRLMQIAKPGELELEVELPVADSIVLQKGARLRVFLDSNPLDALPGKVSQIDYKAHLTKSNVAAYRVVGQFDAMPDAMPRLGTRGSVQVYGPTGTLWLYLLRRPFSAVRQRLGL